MSITGRGQLICKEGLAYGSYLRFLQTEGIEQVGVVEVYSIECVDDGEHFLPE